MQKIELENRNIWTRMFVFKEFKTATEPIPPQKTAVHT